MTDLGTLPGGSYSGATGINDHGQVVGFSDSATNGPHAFLFANGVMTDLGTLGGNSSGAAGINDAGQIVGSSTPLPDLPSLAFLYRNGTMTSLGTLPSGKVPFSSASAINNHGEIAGTSSIISEASHAFVRRKGVMVDLGTLPGGTYSSASAINDKGQVVGTSDTATPQRPRAFLCSPESPQG
jgi:probable HAF family extracellular repeat protein